MNDAGSMRCVECISDLDAEVEYLIQGKRPHCNAVFECFPFEALHHDEWLVFVIINLVNGTDPRMIECGGGTRFALEPFESLGIANEFFRKKLKCDMAAKLEVFRLIHHTH